MSRFMHVNQTCCYDSGKSMGRRLLGRGSIGGRLFDGG